MPTPNYRTAPVPSPTMPSGIPFIIGNEAAERFSFYGMTGILYVFMTQYLRGTDGQLDVMLPAQATVWNHMFVFACYFTPLLGGVIADAFWGKYRTIVTLSVVYCLGHLALALDDTRVGLVTGLLLIALGAGGIKPCVSAHVGDQFGTHNRHLLPRVYTWFYFSINAGSAVSTVLIPRLLDQFGPHVAFGVPGVLMFVATVVFWLGRRRFVHIPPRGARFFRETLADRAGMAALGKLSSIYVFVAMFWCLFHQTSSVWIEQAEHMDRWIDLTWLPSFAQTLIPDRFELLAAEIQAANPLLILLLIPTFYYAIYPAVNRVFPLTPLRKVSIGLFVTALAFSMSAAIESRIDAGEAPHIGWQILAYVVLTAAEVMVSITCLEFSYTQAPKSMKSLVMSLYLLSTAAGNMLTAVINDVIQDERGQRRLSGANYYWFFTAAMVITACAFVFAARRYRGQTHLQDDAGS